MKTLKPLLLLFLTFIFLLPACKEEEMLDPRFSCMINCEEWTPRAQLTFLWHLDLRAIYIPTTQSFYLTAFRDLEDGTVDQILTISADGVDLGENRLNYEETMLNDNINKKKCSDYYLDTLRPAVIIFESIDTINQYARGTFEFSLYNSNCGEQLRLTAGKFNVRLSY